MLELAVDRKFGFFSWQQQRISGKSERAVFERVTVLMNEAASNELARRRPLLFYVCFTRLRASGATETWWYLQAIFRRRAGYATLRNSRTPKALFKPETTRSCSARVSSG